MTKRSSSDARPPRPKAANPLGVSTAERDELRRQGAKAAARGEQSIANPMGRQSNMPGSTGESLDTWRLRKQAWQHGHDVQSGAVDAGRAAPDAQAGVADDLTAIAEDIRKASETLSALHDEIARVRSDEGIRHMAALLQENRRLRDELQALQDASPGAREGGGEGSGGS